MTEAPGASLQVSPAPRSPWRVWIPRLVAVAALAVVIYLFLPLLGEVRAAAELFKTAHWIWLPAAILVQLGSYALLTGLNAQVLSPFPGRIGFLRLAATLTSMAFIEVAIPSAGASGVALRARLLGKHGYSVEASTFTLVLESVFLGVAMGTVALLGLGYLLRRGELTTAGSLWLAALAVAVIALVWGGWRLMLDPTASRRLLAWSVGVWNRLGGRLRRLDLERLEPRLAGFQGSLSALRSVPVWRFVLPAYGRVALDVATLGVCFMLFGHPIGIGTLLTGYGLILLLSGLAALPGGLGVADASVPVVFARLGAPGAVALAAGLTYRVIAFWLLRFIGFISWLTLESRP